MMLWKPQNVYHRIYSYTTAIELLFTILCANIHNKIYMVPQSLCLFYCEISLAQSLCLIFCAAGKISFFRHKHFINKIHPDILMLWGNTIKGVYLTDKLIYLYLKIYTKHFTALFRLLLGTTSNVVVKPKRKAYIKAKSSMQFTHIKTVSINMYIHNRCMRIFV